MLGFHAISVFPPSSLNTMVVIDARGFSIMSEEAVSSPSLINFDLSVFTVFYEPRARGTVWKLTEEED